MFIYLAVLAYSPQGVYVGISNSYAETILDMNTTTGKIHEVSHNVVLDDECNYAMSIPELEACREFFESLLN